MSHALRSVNHVQTCHGKQDWPRIFVAKFDIQGSEYKALVSAIDWLAERTPCYLLLEAYPNDPRVTAILELLLDLGYDSLWRTFVNNDGPSPYEEFPPGPPFWSRSRNGSTTLHQAAVADLGTIRDSWSYRDYLFGFEDQKNCLSGLLD